MDLKERNRENIDYMIAEIKKKLQLVNQDMIRSDRYDTEQYEELRDIYELVQSKERISVSEMQAILGELGSLRKK